MSRHILVCLALALGLAPLARAEEAAPPAAPAAALPPACESPDYQLPFDINVEARWKMAAGERYQPISMQDTPHLYEICRSGAPFAGTVRVASDLGLNVGTEIPRASCVLVYGSTIGLYSERTAEVGDDLGGSFRLLQAAETSRFDGVLRVQAQIAPTTPVAKVIASSMTFGEASEMRMRSASYRFCQGAGMRAAGYLVGVRIGRPDLLTQMPVSGEAAVLGEGSCVDFTGSDVVLTLENPPAPAGASAICARLAYRMNPAAR